MIVAFMVTFNRRAGEAGAICRANNRCLPHYWDNMAQKVRMIFPCMFRYILPRKVTFSVSKQGSRAAL